MKSLWTLLLIDLKYCHCRVETSYFQNRYFQVMEKQLNMMLTNTFY